MWMTALAILVPAVIVWFSAGRLWHWRVPGERWPELFLAVIAALVARALLTPSLARWVEEPWSIVIAAAVGAALGLVVIIGVATPVSGVIVLGCCAAEAEHEDVGRMLRANAGTRQTPGPPYVFPYELGIRRGGAVVWVWDNACPEGTTATIRFKHGSPFPHSTFTGKAPWPIVAKPLLRPGAYPYGLEVVLPDGTSCSSDPIIRGRK